MSPEQIDRLWEQACEQSLHRGEGAVRQRFAELIESAQRSAMMARAVRENSLNQKRGDEE